MKPAFCALLGFLLLTGCAWNPYLPPRTYQGIVYNEPLQRPEPSATIQASRNGFRYSFLFSMASPSLGETRTDSGGHFHLTTTTGYAQKLSAETADGRMEGRIQKGLRRSNDSLVIPVRPSLWGISYTVALPEKDIDQQRSAINKILFHFASSAYRRRHSLAQYAALGVISARERDSFIPYSSSIFTPTPRIRYLWADQEILFPALDRSFVLKKASR